MPATLKVQLISNDKFSMKMENPRSAFLERNFPPFIRTSSDPSRVAAQRARENKSERPLSSDVRKINGDTTPETSPQLQKLTRMNSYRALPKQHQRIANPTGNGKREPGKEGERKRDNLTVPQGKPSIKKLGERRTTSNLGVERIKRKKEDRRMRSQSSPSFPPDLDVTDPSLGTSPDNLSNESLEGSSNGNSNGAANATSKWTPVLSRKKSLMSLKDFTLKKFIETKPKLKRSQSQKFAEKPDVVRVKHPATDDEDSDHNEGPLFQATTLFVPGYDFKNKQSTTLPANFNSRKSSTPQLSRRSSKERMSLLLDKVITRQSSTPCLFKRDSKEKLKKMEPQIEEKTRESTTCLSKPQSVNTQSNKEADEDMSTAQAPTNDDPTPQSFVDQRKATIALRQKQFRDKGASPSFENVSPRNSINVKEISRIYEDGSAYEKVKNLVTKTTDLSLKPSNCEYVTLLQDPCLDYDATNNKTSPSGGNSGRESGYVSPTDNFTSDGETFPPKSCCLDEWTTESDEERMFSNLTVPTREYCKDLCATEL